MFSGADNGPPVLHLIGPQPRIRTGDRTEFSRCERCEDGGPLRQRPNAEGRYGSGVKFSISTSVRFASAAHVRLRSTVLLRMQLS
jgi:hypothetical protein